MLTGSPMSYSKNYMKRKLQEDTTSFARNGQDEAPIERPAYISYLENQLERIEATCMTVDVFSSRLDQIQAQLRTHEERMMAFGQSINILQDIDTRRANAMGELHGRIMDTAEGTQVKTLIDRIRHTDGALSDVVDDMSSLKRSMEERQATIAHGTVTRETLAKAVDKVERDVADLAEARVTAMHHHLTDELNSITLQLSDLKRANSTLTAQAAKVSDAVPEMETRCTSIAQRDEEAHVDDLNRLGEVSKRACVTEQRCQAMGAQFQASLNSLQLSAAEQDNALAKLRQSVASHADAIDLIRQERFLDDETGLNRVRDLAESAETRHAREFNELQGRFEAVDLRQLENSLDDLKSGIRTAQSDVVQLKECRDGLSRTIERVGTRKTGSW
ncbi:Chromosome partition protein Smc [Carpediemonas membranifera]|uniref:Chromosome partition protein Smc n=1 Tax=Carpediemonas membranifera TaxID=201153 RepID=A0A8J6AT43_9EUKA|nr:Chromosome partition protein Smc [Carpediemonas membranifera]|eukprot:KAG9393841.1 Chromosome partition protein Smc [Carpediemonas membranifera]